MNFSPHALKWTLTYCMMHDTHLPIMYLHICLYWYTHLSTYLPTVLMHRLSVKRIRNNATNLIYYIFNTIKNNQHQYTFVHFFLKRKIDWNHWRLLIRRIRNWNIYIIFLLYIFHLWWILTKNSGETLVSFSNVPWLEERVWWVVFTWYKSTKPWYQASWHKIYGHKSKRFSLVFFFGNFCPHILKQATFLITFYSTKWMKLLVFDFDRFKLRKMVRFAKICVLQ